MLLKDTAAGLEVFALRRVAGMAFAAGMTVFPGGAVDTADDAAPLAWVGPDTTWWAERLGVSARDAASLVVAAVRELFEETGVLLAGPALVLERQVTDADRLAILDRRLRLPAVLAAAGLPLRADLLRPWANWITPPGHSRRYDTFFFAAALPPGQRAEMLTTEADLGQWRTPRALLAAGDVRGTALMPPTTAVLADLAGFDSVADVLAEHRVITPVRVWESDLPDMPPGSPDVRREGKDR